MLCILNYYTYLCIVLKRIRTLILNRMEIDAQKLALLIIICDRQIDYQKKFKQGKMSEPVYNIEKAILDAAFNQLKTSPSLKTSSLKRIS